jgi:hypothetical protein
MKHEKTFFNNQEVILDDNEFHHCNFEDCNLIYSGGKPPSLNGCSFSKVRWSFTGPAADTVAFMRALYHGCGEGGQSLIEQTFEAIRENAAPVDIVLH